MIMIISRPMKKEGKRWWESQYVKQGLFLLWEKDGPGKLAVERRKERRKNTPSTTPYSWHYQLSWPHEPACISSSRKVVSQYVNLLGSINMWWRTIGDCLFGHHVGIWLNNYADDSFNVSIIFQSIWICWALDSVVCNVCYRNSGESGTEVFWSWWLKMPM
jgi:hypothetical protein